MRSAARTGLFFSMMLLAAMGVLSDLRAAERVETQPAPVPSEEYPLYDLVVRDKFLTSQTTMVVIERLTVARTNSES